jgi:hypothetical protein
MQRRYTRTRFEVLLGAAENYLAGGGDLATLDSHKAQVLRTAPQWFGGSGFPAISPNKMFQVQWALGQWHPGLVAVGVEGSYEALQPLITHYGPDSTGIYFPFPHKLGSTPSSNRGENSAPALMVMEFTRAGLARAAARVARPGVPP